MALQICVEGLGVIEGAEICTLENMSVPWRPLQRGLLYSKVLRMIAVPEGFANELLILLI